MNFDEFKAEFVKENFKLKMMIVLSLVVFSVGTFGLLVQRQYYIYKGGEVFKERPLAEEICKEGLLSVLKGEVNPYLVHEDLKSLLDKDPLELQVQNILSVKSQGEGSCRVLLSGEGKLHSYEITLKGLEKNPFFYKITHIEEIEKKEEGV